jgi:hypothetical protein
MLLTSVCSAKNTVHHVEDTFAMDKWAHMGLGYFMNDQLKRQTELTGFERLMAITAVAYAKERWADSTFDRGDMAATMFGGIMYEQNF